MSSKIDIPKEFILPPLSSVSSSWQEETNTAHTPSLDGPQVVCKMRIVLLVAAETNKGN